MFFYLDTFAFENPKSTVTEQDVVDTLKDLLEFIKKLTDYDSDVILTSNFLYFEICNKDIYTYLHEYFDEDEQKLIYRRVDISSSNVHCSDLYEDYLIEDMEIDYLLCKEKTSEKEIFGTFLACSLFTDSPIVTPNKLCDDTYFLKDNIEIVSSIDTHKLLNYQLSHYTTILDKFDTQEYITLDTWEDYIAQIKNEFLHVEFTKSCIKDLKRTTTSISNKYITLIRKQVELLNNFVVSNGGTPKSCDNISTSGVNARQESSSRLDSLKETLEKKDCNNTKRVMSWHTRIDFYRLYFTCDFNNKICFTFFTKKIPNIGS